MKQFFYLLATDRVNGGFVSILKCLLWFLSWIYAVMVILRRLLYQKGFLKRSRLPYPVISVGNITTGGVGKTPLVEFIAATLISKKIQPAILIRGYMGEGGGDRKASSDEAAMLQSMLPNVPVLTGANRVKNAQTFLEHNTADVFILDDGFQHLKLLRDIDIVVIDTTNPWGNGNVLPRGILREPPSALGRVDIFVLTKTDLGKESLEGIKSRLTDINPKALIVEAIHRPTLLVDARSGEVNKDILSQDSKICAVSSIGSPDSFDQTLRGFKINLVKHFIFMDHYCYTQADVNDMIQFCQDQGISAIVTTDKDIVKLRLFLGSIPAHISVLSLKIKIHLVNGEDQFFERIDHIL